MKNLSEKYNYPLPSISHPVVTPLCYPLTASLCLPVIIGAMSIKNDLSLIITILPFHRPISAGRNTSDTLFF